MDLISAALKELDIAFSAAPRASLIADLSVTPTPARECVSISHMKCQPCERICASSSSPELSVTEFQSSFKDVCANSIAGKSEDDRRRKIVGSLTHDLISI